MNESFACTNCGSALVSRSCKMRCPRCGYFEDCSDTGLPAYSSSDEKVARSTETKSDKSDPIGG